MESRSVKSSKTAFFSITAKTLDLLIAFVTRTLFIKIFGVGLLGVSGLFTNVISILALADLGFGTAMTYSYYKPIADNDYEKIAQLNRFYRKVYNVIAVAVLVIGLALTPFLKYIINLKEPIDHLYLYYIITLSNTVVSYLFVYKSSVINAHQEGYLISRITMILNIAFSILRILVMVFTKNYAIYIALMTVSTLVNNLYVSHLANKRYPYIKKCNTDLPKEERSGIFKNVGSAFLYKVSSVLMNSTDNILISKIVGTEIVGFYSNYLTIINTISAYVSIVFYSLTASIGNVIAKESNEKQYSTFREVQIMSYWFAIVVSSCVYVLIDSAITVWLGNTFLLDGLTVIAIAVNFYLACVLYPIWIFREAAGLYRKTKYIMIICALINVGLSILLGKLIGLSGILFASAISKLLTYVWYEPIVLFRDYMKDSAKKYFLPVIFVTAVTVGVSFVLRYVVKIMPVSGIIGFIINGIICFAISNIVFLIIYGRNPYFKALLNRGKALLSGFLGRIKNKKA